MSPKDCTSFKIRKMDRLLARQYDLAMAESSLKSTQFSLLTNIKNYGPLGLSELANKMTMDPSTLTRNLRLVKEQGWVKQVSGADARNRLVSITPKGAKKQEEAKMLWEPQQQRIMDTLGAKQTAALNAMLDKAIELLKGAGGS